MAYRLVCFSVQLAGFRPARVCSSVSVGFIQVLYLTDTPNTHTMEESTEIWIVTTLSILAACVIGTILRRGLYYLQLTQVLGKNSCNS